MFKILLLSSLVGGTLVPSATLSTWILMQLSKHMDHELMPIDHMPIFNWE